MGTLQNTDFETFDFQRGMNACFDTFDKNKDGKIDFSEFRLICGALFRNEIEKVYNIEETRIKEIFDVFDSDKNNFIDAEEFLFCWNNWIKIIIKPISALCVIDVQNDFITGSLKLSNCPAGHNGLDVVTPINNLLETVKFDLVFYSLDWHPDNHISFIDNINNRKIDPSSPIILDDARIFDTVIFAGTPPREQKLYPRHCVKNTWGSELHKDLKIVEDGINIYKGTCSEVDLYSIFWDGKTLSDSTANIKLKEKNVTDVFFCGIAYDVCVDASASDAQVIGYRTIVVDDCCRGINFQDIEKTKQSIIKNNGVIVHSDQVKAMVEGRDKRPELGYKLAITLKNAGI